MSYPTFTQLQRTSAGYKQAYSLMNSAMLTREGRLTRDMWRHLDAAFSSACDLEDALTTLSFDMDDLADKLGNALFDRSYLRDLIKALRTWVLANVDKGIWSDYPVIVNPYAA